MNLKARIEKVEKYAKVSDFCVCHGNPRCVSVYWEDGKPSTRLQLKANRTPIPDTCKVCGKPINKTTIIVDFVSPTMPKPEGAK